MRLWIEGMTCQGCVDAVTRAIGRAAPGRPVKIDLATGAVELGEPADPAEVATAIERAGFRVVEPPTA